MRVRITRWLLVPLILVLVLSAALPALAHAAMRRATPGDQSVVQPAPADVRLLFDEEMASDLNKIKVYGPDGSQVDNGDTHTAPTDVHTLMVTLRAGLPVGGYRVWWHVVSLDGHVVEGTYTFSVGVASPAPALPSATTAVAQGPGPLTIVLYFLGLLGLLSAAGLALFYGVSLAPVLPEQAADGVLDRWRRLTTWALLVWLLAVLASLPLHAAQATGSFSPASIWADLTAGTRGNAVGLQVAAGVAALVLVRVRTTWVHWGVALLGTVALLGNAMGGHAASLTGSTTWPVLADWLHLLSVALWWGGIVGFLALGGRTLAPEAIGRAVKRFSPQAMVAVLVLVLSGLYSSLRHVPVLAGLTDTPYGWTLLGKIVLLLPLLLLGAANQLKAGPRLLTAAAEPDGSARFRRQVGVEVGLMVVVLVLGAWLANSNPAEAELLKRMQPGPLRVVQQQGDLTLQADLPENQVGLTILHITLWKAGKVLDGAEVSATLDALDMDMGHQAPELKPVGPGQYEAQQVVLAMSGLWDLRVKVHVAGAPDQQFRIKFLTPEGAQ